MQRKPTVRLEPVEGHPAALWLRWEAWVIEADVRPVFHQLTQRLDAAKMPIHILVDLRLNPRLPLQTTIFETLSGPVMHQKMGEWLVIGSNQRAQIIADVIIAVEVRTNIHWFETEEEAFAYLRQLEAKLFPAWD